MKIKICYAILLVFIVTGAFCGCGTTTNGTKSSFEELDVHYITKPFGQVWVCNCYFLAVYYKQRQRSMLFWACSPLTKLIFGFLICTTICPAVCAAKGRTVK